MIKFNLYGIIPVFKFFIGKNENENYQFCLENYITNIQLILPHLNQNIKNCKALKLRTNSNLIALFNFLNVDMLGFEKSYDFVRIDAIYEIDDKEVKELNPKFNFTKLDLAAGAALDVSLAIEDSIIFSSIAYVGHLQSAVGQVFYKKHPFNLIDSIRGYSSSVFYDNIYTNWPKLNLLDIKKVIEWESKLGLFNNGFSSNPVQKAFASYTHILKHSSIDTFEMLFWAMQGLEGFYCNGKGELRNQLKEKTKLLLGPWSDKKNIVGHLYDLRSKFVHGDFPVVRWKNEYEQNNNFKKEYSSLYDGTTFSLQVLIATIQTCIEENIIDIDYSYSIIKKKA